MTAAAIAEALDEVEHECPRCGARETTLVRGATVAHRCPKDTTKGRLTTFRRRDGVPTGTCPPPRPGHKDTCARRHCGNVAEWIVATLDVETEKLQTAIRLCTTDATYALLLDRDDVQIRKAFDR